MMKVVLLKSGLFSFSPAEPPVAFMSGVEADLPTEKADFLVSVGWARAFDDDVAVKSETKLGKRQVVEPNREFDEKPKQKGKKNSNPDEEFIHKAILDVVK